ncbi:MAG TPA: hypothetical protein VFL83_07305 [Anaeromyxobacter sp.]|nr:hypothetical protein [Anaeromyxobacter sp.]
MTDERRGEDAFFAAGARPEPPSAPPRRRESPLLVRNPAFAILALAVCAWLLWDWWPEAAWFFAPRTPIDLGGPGAYHLALARENRLATVRGELAQAVPVTEARSGQARTVGRLAGTNLVVDRPGRGGPPVFEGRILPAARREDYAGAVAEMRARGAPALEGFLVLRDGERPRTRWLPVAGSAILALLVLVNLRALVKHLTA